MVSKEGYGVIAVAVRVVPVSVMGVDGSFWWSVQCEVVYMIASWC